MKDYRRNLVLLNLQSLFSGFWFYVPILYVFLREQGLTLTEIGLLTTIKLALKVSLEIPSGYVSDRFGRRCSMMVSSLAFCGGYLAYGVSSSLVGFGVAAGLVGVGLAFLSGADYALAHETLSKLNESEKLARVLGSRQSLNSLGLLLGSILCTPIVTYLEVRWTFFASSGFALAAFFSSFAMYEETRPHQRGEQRFFFHLVRATRYLGSSRDLVALTVLVVSIDLAIQLFFQYQQFALQELGVPSRHFGPIYAILMALTALSSRFAHVLEANARERVVGGVLILMIATAIGCVWLGPSWMWMGFGILIIQVAFGFSKPVLASYFQNRIPSDQSSTIVSVQKFGYSLVFMVTAPLIGYVGDLHGYRYAIASLLVPLACALLFLSWVNESKA